MDQIKNIVSIYDTLYSNGMYTELSLKIFEYTGDLNESEDELIDKHTFMSIKSYRQRFGIMRLENESFYCRLCNHYDYKCLFKKTNHCSSGVHKVAVNLYKSGELEFIDNNALLWSHYKNNRWQITSNTFIDFIKTLRKRDENVFTILK